MKQTHEYEFLGNFSAVDPAYSRHMYCHDCETSWIGCWDNFQCPKCQEGELPTYELNSLIGGPSTGAVSEFATILQSPHSHTLKDRSPLSQCCGAPPLDEIHNGFAMCSDCKDHAEFKSDPDA